jgi:hypothetical protein
MTNTPATSNEFNQPRYWFKWVLATAGGWLIGFFASIVISVVGVGLVQADPTQMPPTLELILAAVILLVTGFAVGTLQWLVLRQEVPTLQLWGALSALGLMVTPLAGFAFMGLGVGLAQWLLLRRVLNRTGWWPVMSAVAWPVGYMFGGSLGGIIGEAVGAPFIGALVGAALIGAIIGAITGAVLLWMLRENRVLLDGLREDTQLAKP